MYDDYLVYPIEAYRYLYLGIGLVIIAFLIIQYKRKNIARNEVVHHFREKDNRVFIDKVWANKTKLGDKAVGVVLITLVIIALFDLGMAISVLIPIMVLGAIILCIYFYYA